MRTITAAQAGVRASGVQAEHYRVQVKDSGGIFRDLTTWPGFNALDSVTVTESVDSPHMVADVLVKREMFKLSLAPMMTGSALNRGFNPASSPAPLIALAREFKVEVAIMPMDRAPSSGDWMEVFRGRIDHVDPAVGAQVRFGGRDLSGRIADQQIKKERVYAFATDGGVAVSLRPWQPGMVVAVGEYVLPASNGPNDSGANKFLKCTTAGTTGSTEPTWTTGAGQTDGSAVWNYIGAPSSVGRPVEQVMQNLLDDNKAASDSSVTLYTPSSPSWAIKEFIQDRTRNLQAIRARAQQIGWDVRQKWRPGTSQFELTFYEPERSKTVADYTFAASDYEEPTKLEVTVENIRNAWRGTYSDPADLWPDGTPKRKEVEVSDSASIAKYGELWAEISEASASNVDTSTEMNKLLNAALSDCAEPTADTAIALRLAFPWVESGDLYTFKADGRRYDTDQKLAVTGYKLVGANRKLRTEFVLRGKPALSAYGWIANSTTMPFAQGETQPPPKFTHFPGGKNPSPSTLKVPGGVGVKMGGDSISPAASGDTEYEVHVSQTSGFTPSSSTLKGVIKGQIATVQELRPGVDHYGKIVPRVRERSGRLARGQPGAQFSFQPSRVKSGLLDRLAVAGGIPNSDFKDVFDSDPENSLTPPEHWSLDAGSFGPTGDARNTSDATYGNVLELRQTGTNAILRSEVWRLRMGATDALLSLRVKQTGTQSAGRNLHVEITFFSDSAGVTSVGSYDTVVPNAFAAVNTWAVYSESIVVPAGATYAKVRFYKEATSSAYGWAVGNLEINESGLIQPAWIAVSGGVGFNTGWSNVGSGNVAAAYFKDSHGVVHLRGRVQRTSGSAALIFTLPTGYRPASIEAFATEATNAFGQITVYADGKVQLDFGTATYCSLSGITFDTR